MNEDYESTNISIENVEEEEPIAKPEPGPEPEPIPVCKCLRDDESSQPIFISARKQAILTTAARTESYIRDRQIPELIRFLLTKLLSEQPERPIAFFEKLLDDCMLFRAGHGLPPVLYEDRHLEAVVKSFDPGDRGWLSAGQIRRAFTTLDLIPDKNIEERVPTEMVLKKLKKAQERQLFNLLISGMNTPDDNYTESGVSSSLL